MSQSRQSTMPGVADSSLNGAGPFLRVKITGAINADQSYPVGVCGASDLAIGVIDNQQANALNARVNILLANDNKTKIMSAAGAITANTLVYAAAAGHIAATGTLVVGLALQAATAQNDQIEVLPITVLNGSASYVARVSLTGAADAIPPHTAANYAVDKAGVDAMTLAAPTAGTDDGLEIDIISDTANAHTLTATGLLQTGSANVNLATFAAFAGAGLRLQAKNGKWQVIRQVGITFS